MLCFLVFYFGVLPKSKYSFSCSFSLILLLLLLLLSFFFFNLYNTVDRFNTTPLQNAIDGGHEEVVVLLSDAGAVLGASMLGESLCCLNLSVFFVRARPYKYF